MPPKATPTVPPIEHGLLEIRCIPGRRELELWIGNRKVFEHANAHSFLQAIPAQLQQHAYRPGLMPHHITLFALEVPGLPSEEDWKAIDAAAAARAAAQSESAPAAPAPATPASTPDDSVSGEEGENA